MRSPGEQRARQFTPHGVNAKQTRQAAFLTRPERMQEVHTRTCWRTPSITARTRCRFGFQRRRRVLFAWLITFPKLGPLPQILHFIAINTPHPFSKLTESKKFSKIPRFPHLICRPAAQDGRIFPAESEIYFILPA